MLTNTKTDFSPYENNKAEFVKFKILVRKTNNENNSSISSKRCNSILNNLSNDTRNIKSVNLQTPFVINQEKINNLNLNPSIVSNGKVDYNNHNNKEKAFVNLSEVKIFSQENRSRKISQNPHWNNKSKLNNLYNETSKKKLIETEVNGIEVVMNFERLYKDKETMIDVFPNPKDTTKEKNDYDAYDKYEILKNNLKPDIETCYRTLNEHNRNNTYNYNYLNNNNNNVSYSYISDNNNNKISRKLSYPDELLNKDLLNTSNHLKDVHITSNTNNSKRISCGLKETLEYKFSLEKDFRRSLSQVIYIDKSFKKDFKSLSSYERLRNTQQLINTKKQALKTKILELYEIKNKFEIMKTSKHPEKRNEPRFEKRMEISNFESVKKNTQLNFYNNIIFKKNKLEPKGKSEVKEKQSLKPKINKINLQQKKTPKKFSEKKNAEKIERLESETKQRLVNRQKQEIYQFNQYTFKPVICSKSREINPPRAKRRTQDLAKSNTHSNLNQKRFSYERKYHNLDRLDPAHTMHNISCYINNLSNRVNLYQKIFF